MRKLFLQKLFLLVCLAAGLAAPGVALAASGDLIPTFGTGGVKTFSFPNNNAPYGAAIDSTGIYIAGADDSGVSGKKWRIEKRDLVAGNLISAFDGDGILISDPRTFTDDTPYTLLLDSSGLYVIGGDSNVSNPGYNRWRIEKYRIDNGAPCTAANCGTQFGSSGVVTSDPNINEQDVSFTGVLDGSAMYILGTINYRISFVLNCGWRIEKRDTTTGALISGFGSGGAITFGGSNCFWSDPPDLPNIPPNIAAFAYSTPYMPSIVVDTVGIYVYVYGTQIYKFDKTTGTQIGGFNPKSPGMGNYSDTVFAMAVDSSGLYIVGEAASAFHPNRTGWLVEKRDITTGDLIVAFSPNSLIGPDSAYYNANNPYAIKLDGSGGIYIAGEELVTGQSQWRVENRDITTGTLNTSFGASGIATSDPTTYNDGPHHILIGSDGFYTIGATGRSWSAPSPRQGRIEKRELGGGGGPGPSGVDCGVRMYDSTSTVTLTCEDPPVSPLRIYQGTKTYGISVVDPADANASRFRIQTPSGVKALRRQ